MLLGIVAFYVANQTKTQDTTPYGSVPPWPVFIASVTVSSLCRQFADWLTPPAVRVFETSFAINRAAAVYACSKVGFPEALEGGPKSCADLSKAAGMSVPMGRRLLRACVASGMFHELTAGRSDIEDADRIFVNSPMGDVLRDSHPYSVKHFIGHQIEDAAVAILRIVDGAKDESKIPFSLAWNLPHTGHAIWEYFAAHPSQDVQFNKAMTALDGLASAALVHDFTWGSKCSTVVDIGQPHMTSAGQLHTCIRAYTHLNLLVETLLLSIHLHTYIHTYIHTCMHAYRWRQGLAFGGNHDAHTRAQGHPV